MSSAFQNLSVRAKMTASFAVVIVLVIGLGALGVTRISSVNAKLADISGNWLPSTQLVGQYQYLVTRARVREGAYLLQQDPAQSESSLRDITNYRTQAAKIWAKYQPLVGPGHEADLAHQIELAWNDYQAASDDMIATRRAKGTEAALLVFDGRERQIFNRLVDALQAETDFQVSGSDRVASEANDVVRLSNILTFIGGGLAVLLAGSAGFVLVRAVSSPLLRMTNVMEKLGEGDMSVDVPNADRKDEIGILAKAILAFKEQLATIERVFMPNVMVAAVRSSSTAVMTVDRNLMVTFVNDATKKLFRDNLDIFRTLVPSIDPEKLVGICIDSFHKNPSHQRQMLSDPSRLPHSTDITVGPLLISLYVSAVIDTKGRYVGNVMEWADVTDARLNEGKMNALQVSQAIVEFDTSGNFITANKNFLAVMGYSIAELAGQHHSLFVEPAYRNSDEYRQFWERLNRGETISEKFRRVAKGSREVWLQASYNPIFDRKGKVVRVVKLATDVTALEHERAANEKERAEKAAEQAMVVRSLASGLKELSGGNLTPQIKEPFAGEYEQLRSDFNAAVTRLHDTVQQVLSSTSGISTGADEISQAADDLSKRTEQQAASLEETAAALEEITATVKKTAQNAKDATAIVTTAKVAAENGGRIVETAIQAMGAIEQSSKQITDIIGVIDEIAFQTNLLALNAGVEAARAGDAGKGFAVVASEVRALAQRSSEAAREIKTLIKASGEQVNSGVKLVGESGEALKKIVDQVVEVNALVTEMAQAAQQQSTGIEEVNVAVSQMDQVTQQNAAMVEQSTAASRNLATETNELSTLVSFFKVTGETKGPAAKPAAPRPKPAPATAPHSRVLAGPAPTRGNAALAMRPARPDAESWEEF